MCENYTAEEREAAGRKDKDMASKWKCTRCGNFDFVISGICGNCADDLRDEANANEMDKQIEASKLDGAL